MVAVALQEFDADFLFQLTDLHPQGGLGNMEPFRRAPEVQLLGGGHEIPQMAQFHA